MTASSTISRASLPPTRASRHSARASIELHTYVRPNPVNTANPNPTCSAAGELVFHVFGAIVHFERRLISERTRDGIAARSRDGFGGAETHRRRIVARSGGEATRNWQGKRLTESPPHRATDPRRPYRNPTNKPSDDPSSSSLAASAGEPPLIGLSGRSGFVSFVQKDPPHSRRMRGAHMKLLNARKGCKGSYARKWCMRIQGTSQIRTEMLSKRPG